MDQNNIGEFVIITTAIFLIAPGFLIIYVIIYNRRKKKHHEEKEQMKKDFGTEIIKTQLEVQEQTMQTIGADLHDNIGQLLSLTSLTLKSIELDDPEKVRSKVNTSIDLTLRAIKEMRLLGKLLQGDQLVALGLSAAIQHEINWLEKSGQYNISYTCEGDGLSGRDPDKDLILFRILQEVLNNIIKHAFASQINITLSYAGNELQLSIGDNGVGFDASGLSEAERGMGLHNIQKRAKIIGGHASIQSQAGKGTHVTINIPYLQNGN